MRKIENQQVSLSAAKREPSTNNNSEEVRLLFPERGTERTAGARKCAEFARPSLSDFNRF